MSRRQSLTHSTRSQSLKEEWRGHNPSCWRAVNIRRRIHVYEETMEKAEAILNHTLEIICLLTTEDYILVKREADGDECVYSLRTAEVHHDGPDSSATPSDLSFTLLGLQDRNQKKILELTNQMIRLLTCEVPLKCQDVAVYFSKEEWEYLEGHGEHYNYKRTGEAKDPLSMNHQDIDRSLPAQHRIKEEPDTREYEEVQPTCLPLCHVKSEPGDGDNEEAADRIYAGSPQCLSSVISHISEKPDVYNARLTALDNDFIKDPTVKSEIIYQLTVTDKRCRKSRSGAKTSPCGLCRKRFSSKASLSRHLKLHLGEKAFPCHTCGKRFSCKNHVDAHLRIHTGERPFSCAECGRRFTNHSHLVLHKVVHTKEKPYTCPVCGRGFTRQSSVVKHAGIHAEKKPFVCNECGKSYCQYANLVVHKRLHSGEKPFSCKHCEKGFICKATMQRHELSHTGEKPFACPQCEKCFVDNSTLNKHKRRVHINS
ncbi:uncharacterized protein [Phyllobates terribilis]|uniref:uncharacterized protein isoform X3 n=1 Tax=Phyllobates terribilis TaxID=111132 RepID=UPI003CCAA003